MHKRQDLSDTTPLTEDARSSAPARSGERSFVPAHPGSVQGASAPVPSQGYSPSSQVQTARAGTVVPGPAAGWSEPAVTHKPVPAPYPGDAAPLSARHYAHHRRTPRDLVSTNYSPPDDALLAAAARTYVPESDTDLPSSHTRRAPGAPVYGRALPDGSPAWMLEVRELSAQLEALIDRGNIQQHELLAIQRAALGFGMLGVAQAQIARVAHLVHRAHQAIRNAASDSESGVLDCAEILHRGLPGAVRRVTHLDSVLDVVRSLRDEADPWVAVVEGTSTLLGWQAAARLQAANAIRVAIEDRHRR